MYDHVQYNSKQFVLTWHTNSANQFNLADITWANQNKKKIVCKIHKYNEIKNSNNYCVYSVRGRISLVQYATFKMWVGTVIWPWSKPLHIQTLPQPKIHWVSLHLCTILWLKKQGQGVQHNMVWLESMLFTSKIQCVTSCPAASVNVLQHYWTWFKPMAYDTAECHRLFRLRTRDWKRNHVSQWLLYIASKQSVLEHTLKLPPVLKVLNFWRREEDSKVFRFNML